MDEYDDTQQFYLRALMPYWSPTVTSIVKKLSEEHPHSEFVYLQDAQMVRVTCLHDDKEEVIASFYRLSQAVEDKVFENPATNPILPGSVFINDTIHNKYIAWTAEATLTDDYSGSKAKALFPPKLRYFAHKTVWNGFMADAQKPNQSHCRPSACSSLEDLLSPEALLVFGQENNIQLDCNHATGMVFLAADNAEAVQTAVKRLDNLMEMKKIKSPKTGHVFYPEVRGEIRIETRHLHNADPKLLTTTLVDNLRPDDAYNFIFRGGARQQLAPFDVKTERYMSELGPMISSVKGPARRRFDDERAIPYRKREIESVEVGPSSTAPFSSKGFPVPGRMQKVIEQARPSFCSLVEKALTLFGAITIRAEFGRAVLYGLDPSALSFNAKGTVSNGWTEDELTSKLRKTIRFGRKLMFTKILTQNGDDVLRMVQVGPNAQPLWEKPTRSVVYSFTCFTSSCQQFTIDVEVGQDNAAVGFSIRTSVDSESDQMIFIYGLRRNWDLRLLLSQQDSPEAVHSNTFGRFARAIQESLKVTDANNRLFNFTVPNMNVSDADVQEARILTKWCYAGVPTKSTLHVTEVELVKLSRNGVASVQYSGRPYTQPERQSAGSKGVATTWYEAAVSSAEADAKLAACKERHMGDRAPFVAKDFNGCLGALCVPALAMLEHMDQVGAGNDNRQMGSRGAVVPRQKERSPWVAELEPAPAPSLNDRMVQRRVQRENKGEWSGFW